MPITQVVCPGCGSIMDANALQAAGYVSTPCRECNEEIWVETDERGRISGIMTGTQWEGHEGGAGEFEARRRRGNLAIPTLFGLIVLFFLWFFASRACTARPPAVTGGAATELSPTTETATPKAEIDWRQPLRFSDIQFGSNNATLSDSDKAVLNNLIDALKNAPAGRVFEISGHTDNTGGFDHNWELSRQRAEAVRNYLVEQGVPGKVLITKGYGDTNPIASNATEEGKAQNRRIEFKLIE